MLSNKAFFFTEKMLNVIEKNGETNSIPQAFMFCKFFSSAIWGLTDFYNETRARLRALREQLCTTEDTCGEMSVKRRKSDDGRVLIEMPMKYIRYV